MTAVPSQCGAGFETSLSVTLSSSTLAMLLLRMRSFSREMGSLLPRTSWISSRSVLAADLSTGVPMPYRLFSQMKMAGSFQSAAIL
ncbi:hypothetical protein EYF80_048703 [Liparis tanakae]|uniref:Uncharacterized protein n=1 Tax=Liparis tanakae TaxID=230148 RepID=A0A4Z2FIU1_9TELE|nr:hypothetical protein EYF80_048703 [Liparis tanakae]